MELWTAFLIGFLGSFHCIGMCGPIALALPQTAGSRFTMITEKGLYNLGRITTYSFMGALFGIVGYSMTLGGFQKTLSILLGIIVIAAVFLRGSFSFKLKELTGVDRLYRQLQKAIKTRFHRRGMSIMFSIGVLNGFLPCGLVYAGLAGSLTTGSISQGALYMVIFGLGTFPAMMAISLAPDLISLGMRRQINRFIPVFTIGFGLFLIYRGIMMGFGHSH